MYTFIYCLLLSLGAFVLVASVMLTALVVGAIIRAVLCLIPYAVAIGLSFVLFGCGDIPREPPQAFKSADGSETPNALALVTAEQLRGYIDVDIRRVNLHFFTNSDDQLSRCQGFAGCTKPQVNGYQVNVYWPEEGWDEQHAALTAHELCHVYYFQTGEGGDPDHTHTECYARPDSGLYPGEGYAWQTALEIVSEYGH